LQVATPHASPTASALTLHRDSAGYVRLIVRAPEARLVEIAVDFTEWRPVSLNQLSNETWGIVVPIAPGVHRINLRIDGGTWIAPVGTTRITSDYGDAVGSFVVP